MPRIVWDAPGSRLYQTGIDRGVLYVDTNPGVPWNGLTSVSESTIGGTSKSYYLDGDKYANVVTPEDLEITLSAYTYPDEFAVCDGTKSIRPGLLLTRQKRKSFNLSYRTKIGSDTDSNLAYKIHLIYNATALPTVKNSKTINNSAPDDFSWKITTIPVTADGYRRTSHVVIDSRYIDPSTLAGIENILYGDDATTGRMPSIAELTDFIDTGDVMILVDHGDGTYTVTAPMTYLTMLDEGVFQLTWPTAVFTDTDHYTITG